MLLNIIIFSTITALKFRSCSSEDSILQRQISHFTIDLNCSRYQSYRDTCECSSFEIEYSNTRNLRHIPRCRLWWDNLVVVAANGESTASITAYGLMDCSCAKPSGPIMGSCRRCLFCCRLPLLTEMWTHPYSLSTLATKVAENGDKL